MRSSSRIEPQAHGGTHVLARALGLRRRDWRDLAIATFELGLARVRIATSDRAVLLQPSTMAGTASSGADERVERVRLAVARASHRLPWRADCLVQALAARRWLRRLGVDTSLCIGVPDGKRGQFEAHAWLTHGDKVITGGDISSYIPILESTAAERRPSRKS
jgi:hypothetical protein